MKAKLAMLMALILAASLFAGCGSKDTGGTDTGGGAVQ
ncbi:TRAP transporter substrate-binding protein, partial [Clostridiales bacterium F-3ap]|nr:TRAP transporter substrate-binding protein [Anaerotalea alkaliphila]NDL68244.1 TRAP transporter substrate-binding protein [Anaerotalea alkaliphila]